MSRIHVAEALPVNPRVPGNTVHRAYVHVSTPSGDNSAAVSWQRAFVGSGRAGFTRMIEGIEPDQISTIEKADIESGILTELEVELELTPEGVIVEDRDGTFSALVTARIQALQAALDHYGKSAV